MSNFKCSECGTINIDCGKEDYKTPREIELEKENERLKGWREISHQKINELSERVKNYIKCTNALTCEINDLKEENEATKAQHDTYANLMNIYKNISKGRQDSEIVIDYIDKLKQKLNIAEDFLDTIANGFHFSVSVEKHLRLLAKQALQKMKEVK